MNILQRIAGGLAQASTAAVPEERAVGGWSGGVSAYQIDRPSWPSSNLESYDKAYRNVITVYACVQARAKAVSTAPCRVYVDDGGNQTELPDHPLRALLARPNPMLSEAEFVALTQTIVDVAGFCVIEKERGAAGRVVGLWHLRPDWLQAVPRSGAPADWLYRVPGREPVLLSGDDVMVVNGSMTTDLAPRGLSPIAVALREVGIEDASTEFLKLFIDSGGSPRQALVTSATIKDQAQADAIRERFAQTYGGFRNWLGVVLLSGGLDVKQIGSNLDDMAYPEIRALTEARICSVFGVPPILAGTQVGIDASTYSNYAQARRAFFEDTVAPLWSRLDGAIERSLLPEFDVDPLVSVAFDLTSVVALHEDATAVWQRAASALAIGGITLNQFQSAVGLPGFGDAGDVLYVPSGAMPMRPADLLTVDAAVPATVPAPAPAAASPVQDAPPVGADQAARSCGCGDVDGPQDAVETRYDAAGGDAETRTAVVPMERRARIAVNNRRAVTRVAMKWQPVLTRAFRRQFDAVVDDAVRAADAADETRGYQDIDWTDLDRAVIEALTGLHQDAGRAAYNQANKSLQLKVGVDWSLSNPKIRMTQQALADRIVGINETTKQAVRDVVANALTEGVTMPELAERLQAVSDAFSANRSFVIARTESQVSYNISTVDAYRESGVVYAMQLFDNPDHTDDYGAADGLSCAERNGTVTDVDNASVHIYAEHPNGTLAVSPLLTKPLGEV